MLMSPSTGAFWKQVIPSSAQRTFNKVFLGTNNEEEWLAMGKASPDQESN